MAFITKIRSESDNDGEKVKEVDSDEHSQEDFEDGKEICKAYHQLFEESLKKKTNKAVFKKVNKL